MKFWFNNIFHVLLQYAGVKEVMLSTHNDLSFVHLIQTAHHFGNTVYFIFQVTRICRDSYCVLRAPRDSHSYILQHVYLAAAQNVTLFISFLPEDRNRCNISNTVTFIYKTWMMDKLQRHTLHCVILSSNKFKLQ
jgi:hypothetical protein